MGFRSWWPVDTILASVGTGGLTVPTIANEYAWAAGSNWDVASHGDHCGSHGRAIPLAVGALCAVGVVTCL